MSAVKSAATVGASAGIIEGFTTIAFDKEQTDLYGALSLTAFGLLAKDSASKSAAAGLASFIVIKYLYEKYTQKKGEKIYGTI